MLEQLEQDEQRPEPGALLAPGSARGRRAFRVITRLGGGVGDERLASRHVSALSLRAWLEEAGPRGPRGRELRELRVASGLSLVQAARLLRIGVATVHRLETGEASFVAEEAWARAARILERAALEGAEEGHA